MRRVAIAALGLAAIGVACARPQAKPDEIVFWQPWPPAVVAPMVARFEAANPALRVSVRQVPLASVSDSLAAALEAGAPPDLCVLGPADMPRWLASGALSDWSAGVADLRDSLRGWPLCTVGDALYGLPWLLNARVLACNPALFARARLDPSHPPETWAQLRTAAARIQRLGHGVHGFGISRGDSLASAPEFLAFAWGNGGELLSAGLDSSRFDSPEVLEALEFYLALRKSALAAGHDTLAREFEAGRLGMWITDGTAFASPGTHERTDVALALVPRPAADRGTHASYADGVVLVSCTSSKRKESALRLARSLAAPAAVLELAASLEGLQPATVGADSAAALGDHAGFRTMTRQCASAHFAPPVAHWDSMRIAIGFEVGEALNGRKDAAAAVADAGARIAALVGRR